MTRPVFEDGYAKELGRGAHRTAQLERRPMPESQAGGAALYEIKVFEDWDAVIVGDGIFYWPIPEELGDAELIWVEAGVTEVSSSGPVEIQLRHFDANGTNDVGDVLSTKLTVDVGERNSRQAAVPPVVSGGAYLLGAGDWLRVDIDAAGTDVIGLALMVTLTPSPLGSVAISGAQGSPGGITAWEGPWTTATSYQEGDAVSHGGSSYVSITNHTSGATTEPGVGVDWEDEWMLLAGGEQLKTSEILWSAHSNYLLDIGPLAPIPIYFACTIVEATLLADAAGSAVIDIWKDTYGSYPPLDADSITGASPLTLSSQNKTTNTSLTGWTTAIAAGDVLLANIDSISGIKRLTLALKVERT